MWPFRDDQPGEVALAVEPGRVILTIGDAHALLSVSDAVALSDRLLKAAAVAVRSVPAGPAPGASDGA